MFSLILLLPEEYKYKPSFIPTARGSQCVKPYLTQLHKEEFADKEGSTEVIPVPKLLIWAASSDGLTDYQ